MGQELGQGKGSYHHGDLRAALVQAGLEAAREGGPDAVLVREVTRRAGVSPNAAYRHFADRRALVLAVAERVQDLMAEQMQAAGRAAAQGGVPAGLDPLRAVGQGYIAFALDEPGWFEVGFFGLDELGSSAQLVAPRIPPPFLLLVEALDSAQQAGALTARQRQDAEWPCWSAVHGFAELAVHGPLRGTERPVLDAWAARTVEAAIQGLRVEPGV